MRGEELVLGALDLPAQPHRGMAEPFHEGGRRVLSADDVHLEAVGAELARQRRQDLRHEEVEARDRADPAQVADHQDPRRPGLGLRGRPLLAPVGAGEVRHRVVRVPRADAVPPRPLGVMAAEDADAREAAEEPRGAPVRVRDERELARPAERRPGHRVVAQPQPPRDPRRVREDGEEGRAVVRGRRGDRLDPERHPDVDLAERRPHAAARTAGRRSASLGATSERRNRARDTGPESGTSTTRTCAPSRSSDATRSGTVSSRR